MEAGEVLVLLRLDYPPRRERHELRWLLLGFAIVAFSAALVAASLTVAILVALSA